MNLEDQLKSDPNFSPIFPLEDAMNRGNLLASDLDCSLESTCERLGHTVLTGILKVAELPSYLEARLRRRRILWGP